MRDLTIAEVCRFIKEDEPSLIDTVDSFLTLGLLLSPIAIGVSMSAVEPALGLLVVKNELIKQGKKLFDKFTAKDDKDPSCETRPNVRCLWPNLLYIVFRRARSTIARRETNIGLHCWGSFYALNSSR